MDGFPNWDKVVKNDTHAVCLNLGQVSAPMGLGRFTFTGLLHEPSWLVCTPATLRATALYF
jgi:hypothetical protein